ncbi:hypothetical protein cyc_03220 [Cyclospora cayetanensis]|uniref:Uncharacterized protein n=1 Tax=Cyclospora cayetanensis TaxID=88456 RepID=A0A1D3D6P4_9EIME|nr:hypothetical protein cyc_03220 [Cyclospora cayetanensis]
MARKSFRVAKGGGGDWIAELIHSIATEKELEALGVSAEEAARAVSRNFVPLMKKHLAFAISYSKAAFEAALVDEITQGEGPISCLELLEKMGTVTTQSEKMHELEENLAHAQEFLDKVENIKEDALSTADKCRQFAKREEGRFPSSSMEFVERLRSEIRDELTLELAEQVTASAAAPCSTAANVDQEVQTDPVCIEPVIDESETIPVKLPAEELPSYEAKEQINSSQGLAPSDRELLTSCLEEMRILNNYFAEHASGASGFERTRVGQRHCRNPIPGSRSGFSKPTQWNATPSFVAVLLAALTSCSGGSPKGSSAPHTEHYESRSWQAFASRVFPFVYHNQNDKKTHLLLNVCFPNLFFTLFWPLVLFSVQLAGPARESLCQRSSCVGTTDRPLGSSQGSACEHVALKTFRLSPISRSSNGQAEFISPYGIRQSANPSGPCTSRRVVCTDERLLASGPSPKSQHRQWQHDTAEYSGLSTRQSSHFAPADVAGADPEKPMQQAFVHSYQASASPKGRSLSPVSQELHSAPSVLLEEASFASQLQKPALSAPAEGELAPEAPTENTYSKGCSTEEAKETLLNSSADACHHPESPAAPSTISEVSSAGQERITLYDTPDTAAADSVTPSKQEAPRAVRGQAVRTAPAGQEESNRIEAAASETQLGSDANATLGKPAKTGRADVHMQPEVCHQSKRFEQLNLQQQLLQPRPGWTSATSAFQGQTGLCNVDGGASSLTPTQAVFSELAVAEGWGKESIGENEWQKLQFSGGQNREIKMETNANWQQQHPQAQQPQGSLFRHPFVGQAASQQGETSRPKPFFPEGVTGVYIPLKGSKLGKANYKELKKEEKQTYAGACKTLNELRIRNKVLESQVLGLSVALSQAHERLNELTHVCDKLAGGFSAQK